MATAKTAATVAVTIKPANIQTVEFKIRGTAPLVQARFSEKAKQAMMSKMAQGSTASKSRAKPARDFDEDMLNAMHLSEEGWQARQGEAWRGRAWHGTAGRARLGKDRQGSARQAWRGMAARGRDWCV